jgi:hypothetical protein
MHGELTNSTPEALLVYGPKRAGETFDNSLYTLPAGRKTPKEWDCDGFFVPNDRIAAQALSSRSGPVAVKYRDYRSPVIEMPSPGKYSCPLNEGIYVPGELNWRIPNLGYSEITTGFPEVPNHESFVAADQCQQEILD